MLSGRWPQQNELRGMFGGSLSHNIEPGPLKIGKLTGPLSIYYDFQFYILVDYCMYKRVFLCIYMCFSCFLFGSSSCFLCTILICLFLCYYLLLFFRCLVVV